MLKHLRITTPSALLLALLVVSGCATNPVTGKKELALLSTQDEIEIGKDNYTASQQAEGGQYTVDVALTKYVSSIGQKVAAVSDRDLPYEFAVLNNNTPNAWALPGGKIAINRGLLVELDNEAELAAVLGHEVVHAAARHGANAMQRGILFQTVLLGTAIASADSEYANVIVGGAQVAAQLTSQKYGRDAERESDYYGMKYMHAAGYDTASAVTLQEKFVAFSEGRKSGWLDGLFSSHPPSNERVNNNRESLAEFPTGGMVGRATYQKKIKHLRATKDAYQQADRALRLLAKKDPKAALVAINRAIKKEPREPQFHGIKGHILAQQNRYSQAQREYDAAIKLDSNYYEYFLGRGLVHYDRGRSSAARRDLEASNELLPTALASYHLGDLALASGNRAEAKELFESVKGVEGELGNKARVAYVKLDIGDAPQRYVSTDIIFERGEVVAQVRNLTAYALRNVIVNVTADINGEAMSKKLKLARLAANASTEIESGIHYRDEDAVEALAQVLEATPVK